jgi:hypothetical protein
MTRSVLALVFVVFAGLACPLTLSADVLLIEEVRQAGQMNVPENGMTSTEVSARFGEPLKKHSPVGDTMDGAFISNTISFCSPFCTRAR